MRTSTSILAADEHSLGKIYDSRVVAGVKATF